MPIKGKFAGARESLARKTLALCHRVFPKGYRLHNGSILPPHDVRMGGPEYEDDDFFLDSAIAESKRVLTKLACKPHDFLIDIGCGHGRLPIGLIRESCDISYLGIDVKRDSIDWCRQYIQKRKPAYRFQHVDVVNARYNPSGDALSVDYRLPVETGAVNIVYMWGVFTNMEPEHLPVYAREFYRVLRPGGNAFVTAHVEDGVPHASVNPENYTPYSCQGPLHAVRYERKYVIDTFWQAGLTMTELNYHAAGNCQSDIYFAKQ